MYVNFYHRSCTQCFDLPWLLLSNLCPHEATRIDVHGEFDWLSELICKGKLIWGGAGRGEGGGGGKSSISRKLIQARKGV